MVGVFSCLEVAIYKSVIYGIKTGSKALYSIEAIQF